MFYFHPYLGKIPILTNIFQGGWNHQLEYIKGVVSTSLETGLKRRWGGLRKGMNMEQD